MVCLQLAQQRKQAAERRTARAERHIPQENDERVDGYSCESERVSEPGQIS